MHRWLLVIMVLLLPLRGLAAVAMAGQMLDRHVVAASAAPAGHGAHHASPERGLHDCDDHQARGPIADHAEAGAGGDVPEDCPTCASCQVCSAVVLAPSLLPAFAEAQPQAPPQTAVHAHASAEPALALKPPLS